MKLKVMDLVDFVQKYEHLSETEAIEYIKKRKERDAEYGIQDTVASTIRTFLE